MDYEVSSTDQVDSAVPEEYGGMWFFREALGCENLGMSLLELEPGAKGMAHDHADEGEEEVYLVVDGELTVQLGGAEDEPADEEVTLSSSEAIRVAADTRRQVHNHGDERVRVAIAGAP